MSKFFEFSSRIYGELTGFYSYGYRKNVPGVYINEAIAENFGIPCGMMSEDALHDFVMCSTGGVNGRRIRHGDGLLFKKSDGSYVTVTYEPMKKDRGGYVQEHRTKPSQYKKLSDLPNFSQLLTNAEYHSGCIFCAVSITPCENRGKVFDYACIAEFFDVLRKSLKKPAIHWIGERDYIIMIKPDELDEFSKLCEMPVAADGYEVSLSVTRVSLPAEETADEHEKKLEFCALKLRSGIVGGEYIFSRQDYEKYLACPKLHEILGAIDSGEIAFLPAVSVKTANVKYFYVVPKNEELICACNQAGLDSELDLMLLSSLREGLACGKLPKLSYCVPLRSNHTDTATIAELCAATEADIYIELRSRAKRYEEDLAARADKIKSAGAIPSISSTEAELWSLDGLRRMGFSVINTVSNDTEMISGTADLCRTFGLDCAVYYVDSDEEFIKMRRFGVDICAGKVFSEPIEIPDKTLFAEPHIIFDEEPEREPKPKPFDLSRFTSKVICRVLSKEIKEITAPRDQTVLEPTEKLDPIEGSDLEPLEYEEGIGAKKKRKEAKTEKAKKKLQKKEIKAGKLKKEKLEKK